MIKFELHCHTSPASPCGKVPAASVAQLLWKHGYQGAVVTNHFTFNACQKNGYAEMYARLRF